MKTGGNYYVGLATMGLILASIALVLGDLTKSLFIPRIVLAVIVFFALLYAGIHRFLDQANRTSPTRFLTIFMAAVSVRFMLALALLTIYLYKVDEHRTTVAIALFLVYGSYTAYEAIYWQGRLRPGLKK